MANAQILKLEKRIEEIERFIERIKNAQFKSSDGQTESKEGGDEKDAAEQEHKNKTVSESRNRREYPVRSAQGMEQGSTDEEAGINDSEVQRRGREVLSFKTAPRAGRS